MKKTNETIEYWNGISDIYFSDVDSDMKNIISNPAWAFHNTTWEVISSYMPDLKGKKVPSSGANQAAFAFSLMGANVTSSDISPQQIKNAKKIAKKYHLNIDFIVDDTMRLRKIQSDTYDFVYTSEGVHVWIDDLPLMYSNIYRVLKNGGVYINFEIHPVSRPFKDEPGKLNITKPYDQIYSPENEINYHWRMQDFINAIASSGLMIKHLEEMFDEKDKGHFWFSSEEKQKMTSVEIDKYYNWKTNPQAALPQWFTICAVK